MKSNIQTAELYISKKPNFDGCEIKEAIFCNKIFPKHFHCEWSLGTISFGIEHMGFEKHEIQLFEYSFSIRQESDSIDLDSVQPQTETDS